MKYLVCCCFYKLKLGCGIISIDRLKKEEIIDYRYLTIAKNDCLYICCKQTVEFLFQCYRKSDIELTCATVNDPICCIDLVEFGNEDLCNLCKKLLCSYFSFVLVKYES